MIGIKDINGKDIYVGDILNTDCGGKRIVEYNADHACYYLKSIQGATPKYISFMSHKGKRRLEKI